MTAAFRAALAPYLGFADLDQASIKTIDGVDQALYTSVGEVIYKVTHDAAKEGSPFAWWMGTEPKGIGAGAATFVEAARMLAQLTSGSAGGAAGDKFDESFGRRLAARSRGAVFMGPPPGATALNVLPDLVFATIITTLAPGQNLGSLGVAPRGGVPVEPNPIGERTGSTIQIRHPDGRTVGGAVTYQEFTVGSADVPWALDQLVMTSRRDLLLIPPVVMVPAPAEVWAELPVRLDRGIEARLIGGTFDMAALHERAEEARRIMARTR